MFSVVFARLSVSSGESLSHDALRQAELVRKETFGQGEVAPLPPIPKLDRKNRDRGRGLYCLIMLIGGCLIFLLRIFVFGNKPANYLFIVQSFGRSSQFQLTHPGK